ncbi:MAG: response regulator [Planctomycetes bacterium]|nr:response regulator [Planctomycetota bacterium]
MSTKDEPFRVLLVEDNPAFQVLMTRALDTTGFPCDLRIAGSAEEALEVLAGANPDVIIADYGLPGMDGLRLLRELRKLRPRTSVIMLTGMGSEELAVEAMKLGAYDYVTKSDRPTVRIPQLLQRLKQQGDASKAAEKYTHQLENRVELTEEKYRRLIDQAHEAVFVLDPQGHVLEVNGRGEELVGRSEAGIVGRPFQELVASDEREMLSYRLQTLEMTHTLHGTEARVLRPDGAEVPVELSATVIRATGRSMVMCILRDMSDIQKSKRIQKLLEQRQETLLRTLPLLYYSAGPLPPFPFLWVSENVERLTGFPKHRFDTDPDFWLSRVHPEDRERVRGEFLRLHDVGSGTIEYRWRFADSSDHWILDHAVLVPDERDRPREILGTWLDVTERKRSEEALRRTQERLQQVQRMEAIGRLAGGVAHDFNNLLLIIMGNARKLLRGLADQDGLRSRAEEVLKASDRAESLTRQLLAFSRKQVLAPQVLDLNHVVSEVSGMLRRLIGEDVHLVVSHAGDLAHVRADRGQLEQVLMNLAVNARDAMPHGGELRLETANVVFDANDPKAVGTLAPGPYVLLTVSDTGEGMSPEVRSRLFEPFFTTKELGKGTGLGLSTVYGILRQSGGDVTVESDVGRGTTFRVYLPRANGIGLAAPVALPEEPARGCETVLLVEDETKAAALLQECLEDCGYRVLNADSGEAALRLCQEHAGPIHLLLTDVVMPRMSGPVLADRVLLLRPGIRVVYMSGYTEDTRIRHGVQAAQVDLLQKPFPPETLARMVRSVLDRAPSK